MSEIKSSFIIGIAGGSGSGKTTVTKKILRKLEGTPVAFFSHDSYYRDISEFESDDPSQINFDHPNSLDTKLLIDHLHLLRKGENANQPIYDFTTFRRKNETLPTPPSPVVIVEGILIFHSPRLRDLMDIKIYVDTDADERLIRRIQRDTVERGRSLDRTLSRYNKTVKPMHQQFVEPSKVWADVIIPRGGENQIAINMVTNQILQLIGSQIQYGRRHTDREHKAD